jgi:hypothetical protein
MSIDTGEFTVIAPKPAFGRSVLSGDEPASSLTDSLRALLFQRRGRAMRQDRRATPRVQEQIICVEQMGGTRYLRTTHDLSTFGLSTQHGHMHPVGTEVSLQVQLPDDSSRPLEVRARVVGHNRHNSGMRLAFLDPSRETVRRLHRYLFSRTGPVGSA